MKPVVAIDGPSGAGKSTVARMLARRLQYHHLDTGAMYRAVALAAVRAGVPLDDAPGLDDLCRGLEIRFNNLPDGQRILLNGEDVSEAIRTPEMSTASSTVSAVSVVRRHLVRMQREIGASGGYVAEGRDIGTVVFPGTRAKYYLDADAGERARRRWLELRAMGIEATEEEVLQDMTARDRNDSSRPDSPLMVAEDAQRIDTTGMTPEEVVETIASAVRELEAGNG